MRKLICLLAVCLMLAVLPLGVFADESLQSMIDELPTVEELQAMDNDARLEAYNRTQSAYDAYMALTDAERAELSGAEETFEALFGYFNTLVMPLEAEAEQQTPPAAKDRTATVLSGALVLGVVIVILRVLNKKKA